MQSVMLWYDCMMPTLSLMWNDLISCFVATVQSATPLLHHVEHRERHSCCEAVGPSSAIVKGQDIPIYTASKIAKCLSGWPPQRQTLRTASFHQQLLSMWGRLPFIDHLLSTLRVNRSLRNSQLYEPTQAVPNRWHTKMQKTMLYP